jgi:hypothetical protein
VAGPKEPHGNGATPDRPAEADYGSEPKRHRIRSRHRPAGDSTDPKPGANNKDTLRKQTHERKVWSARWRAGPDRFPSLLPGRHQSVTPLDHSGW